MEDFVTSIFNVFKMVNRKAERQQDRRLKIICLIIFNYVKHMAKEFDINLMDVKEEESINLIPIFEYVAANNIELYDFLNIDINDVDVNQKDDLERFVLSHIYYITQVKNI
jgi:hypothetical protein